MLDLYIIKHGAIMKKIKQFLAVIAVMVLVTLSVAGCALFERDQKAYDNLVVATVGASIRITKKDLVTAYNNWGYQYASSYGYSPEDAIKETLNSLINREILVELSIEKYGPLTNEEKASARRVSFEAFEKSLREIENEIRKDLGIPVSAEEPEDEHAGHNHDEGEEHGSLYQAYDKYLINEPTSYEFWNESLCVCAGGSCGGENDTCAGWEDRVSQYKLNLAKYEVTATQVKPLENSAYLTTVFAGRGNSEEEQKISRDAKDQLVRILANREKGLGYKYDNDEQKSAALTRELERMQREQQKSILTERFSTCFALGISTKEDYEKFVNRGLKYDSLTDTYVSDSLWTALQFENFINRRNMAYIQDLAQQAEDYYKQQVRLAIDRFNKGADTVESVKSSILSGISGVYYVPQNIAREYFTVSHILLSYNDEQKNTLEKLNNDLGSKKINIKEYENALYELKSSLKVRERDASGIETGAELSAAEVLARVQAAVGAKQTAQEKAIAFRDLIYKYNSDPGMNNPEFEYVIGVNDSQMVQTFTDASRELYNYDEATKNGYAPGWKYNEKTEQWVDNRGAISGLVWSDYGVHIIMYTRNISDFVYTNSLTMLDTAFGKTLFATQTAYGNKTAFDTIVENLNKPSYDNYETALVNNYKALANEMGKPVTFNKNNYKDLLKQ